MKTNCLCYLLFLFFGVLANETCYSSGTKPLSGKATWVANPVLPGYFADPSVVERDGIYYVYVTADPWGMDFLACWETSDFVSWKFNVLNWPTKQACTSAASNGNKVWAPSVIKRDGRYYMYVSVGSEVWCGVASHPLGPWENPLDGKPLISFDKTKYCHIIDAEVFADDDGKFYLYWGSGWEWINGRCFVAELNDDMVSLKGLSREVTPENYFEGPFMIKRDKKYYLMYSDGKTIEDTYKVRYAVGDSPFGPFKEAPNSPILQTDVQWNVYGPGHHTVTSIHDVPYILYHRHRQPFQSGSAYRQLCMDSLRFSGSQIQNIVPSEGVLLPLRHKTKDHYLKIKEIQVRSNEDEHSRPQNMTDDNFATLWRPASMDKRPSLCVELTEKRKIGALELLFEYPWQKYDFQVSVSSDKINWIPKHRQTSNDMVGSPFRTVVGEKGRFIKIEFYSSETPGLWEVRVCH